MLNMTQNKGGHMKNSILMKNLALLSALFAGCVNASSDLVDIPSEMLSKGVNANLRANDTTGTGYTKAVGDFDGDGKADYASLKLEDQSTQKYKLVVTLSGANGQDQILKSGDNLLSVGVETSKPGSYKTACSKGAGPASDNCTKEISMKHDGISLFTFESGASLIYMENGRFKEVLIAD
ncbi:hypothetical protein [Pseudomonas solani]|uniref:hypothetical protein n=1 Tax=Pseudomonas solani TaxID=2731552 RepID=UPI003D6BFAB7